MAQSPPPEPDELILAMLREVLARQARQMGLAPASPPPAEPELAPPATAVPPVIAAAPAEAAPKQPAAAPAMPGRPQPGLLAEAEAKLPLSKWELERLRDYEERAAEPVRPAALPATLRSLMAVLAAILVLINLPLFGGLPLARALPDRQALIVRDGLVLKSSGPEIYVLEDNHKRWISSLSAFEHFGYRWEDVHQVDDTFLAQFPDGRPLHVLLKCEQSPHIYRLENDQKRWIKDIPTFEAEGHVWDDVSFISCAALRAIPDGPPIPPDAGPPPQP